MGYARGIHNKNQGNEGQIWDVITHFLPLLKRNWLQAGKTPALVHFRYVILSLWFAFDFISFENIVSLTQGLVADDCILLLFSWSLRIDVVLNENQRIDSWKTWKFTMGSWWGTSVCSSFNYLRFGFCKCFISYKSYVYCEENFNRMVGIVSTKWLVVRWVSWDMVWF